MEGIFVNARLDIIADQKMWNSMALWLKVKQKQIFFTLLLLTLLQKKSTRFGHFGGFVLDFPIFIYW